MHLSRLALVAAFLPFVSSSQVSFSDSTIKSITLVDALSNDSDYTSLLSLLQRARLIPTLNRLNGSTFFAPTNDAIKRHASSNALWHSVLYDPNFVIHDNIQEQLRQQLFYHLINYSVSALPQDTEPLQVLQTLHYPRKPVEPPSRDPPPYPPWMPIPGGTLGGEPQRLRVAARGEGAWVGVDAFGKGGAEITKGVVDADNGVLLGIADVLDPPPDLAAAVAAHSSATYFHNVLTPEITKLLNSTSNLTLFLPVNEAWESLDQYERIYLESKYATDDLYRILKMHAVVEHNVRWSDSFDPAINLTTIDGATLEIVVTPEKTLISTAELVHPDVYASNGVLHLVSSLLIPDGALQLTPEKYLLALNCTSFVSFLHDSGLTPLVNNTAAKYTILAPSDDVLSVLADSELPERGSPEMTKLLKYHFIPGRWTPKKLRSGMLIETALVEPGLGNKSQVLSVEVGDQNPKDESWKSLRFGGATVLREPVEVNNTLIYFISRPIVPPSDALETALPILDLSSFIAALLSTSIGDKIRNTPHTSLLIPHNSAFKRLGLLVSEYLLAASSKADLEKVLLHHTLESVHYADALVNGTQHTFATLEGSDLSVDRKSNGSVFISASGGWAGMKAELYTRDILTQTGVVHELSDILIPRSVELTIGKLMKAAKGSTMVSMVAKAGLDWVLNGTAPPEGSRWAEQGLSGAGWTLLCPTDDAFKQYNLTELYDDKEKLTVIVSQHLIPTPSDHDKLFASPPGDDPLNNNRPLPLDDSATYSTLRSASSAYGDLVFKQSGDASGAYILGIKGARGTDSTADWARVMSWGRSTTGGGTGGVIQIDRMLVPFQPTWWSEYGRPMIVGVFGIFAICAFFYGVRQVWIRDTTEATYEPVGGFTRDDDDS